MNKKKILGVILLSILFVLAGCSKKELSKIEMIEGSYNTDLGLITIDKDKKLVGFEGFGYIYFKEDADKFDKSKLEYYFVNNADKNELKENEAIVAIGIEDKSIYKIQWTASDKTKKVDSITITMTYTLNKSHRKSLYKEYSGVRIQNK
ncbi:MULTISPECIES: hypothetical protein [Streptococcus]|jgi:hypothetical protein|uniref:Lipoprotein n=1 Tax=Streptococcus mitis SK597 TaxID=585204 RepID=E1LQI3_STRMT|nr:MULTISPECIES: hypothetical protein [Streptococcus]EFO01244.1 hypothetical protein SMSK597_0216 [Streptococcus mitis SK597]